MTQRTLSFATLAAAIATTVSLVALGATLLLRPATSVQAQTGVTNMRQVAVSGEGIVTGRPDTATVQIGVETQAATSQEALAQNSAQSTSVQQRLRDLGVAETDIQTSNFSISPIYGENGQQVTGYRVSNMVSVTIRNLDQAGSVLDGVVQVGANSVYGISFSIADQSALLEQARTRAVEDARTRAEQLAKAAGASVGAVLVISEQVGYQPIPMMARAEVAADASVPVAAGEQQISVQVQVTYELR